MIQMPVGFNPSDFACFICSRLPRPAGKFLQECRARLGNTETPRNYYQIYSVVVIFHEGYRPVCLATCINNPIIGILNPFRLGFSFFDFAYMGCAFRHHEPSATFFATIGSKGRRSASIPVFNKFRSPTATHWALLELKVGPKAKDEDEAISQDQNRKNKQNPNKPWHFAPLSKPHIALALPVRQRVAVRCQRRMYHRTARPQGPARGVPLRPHQKTSTAT